MRSFVVFGVAGAQMLLGVYLWCEFVKKYSKGVAIFFATSFFCGG